MIVKKNSVNPVLYDGSLCAMSVDPGVRGTGIAIWEYQVQHPDAKSATEVALIDSFNLMPEGGSNSWLGISRQLFDDFEKIFSMYKIIRVDSEFPQFFGSAGGHSTAASGDLQKLTFIVGVFASQSWQNGALYYPWEVNDWKGQMPKEAVIKALQRRIDPAILTEINPQSHSWDAIGIGMHAHGKFINPVKEKHVY